MRTILILAALPVALGGCGQRDNEAPQPQASEPATSSTSPASDGTDTVGIPEQGIPTALQGRWGLVPADCTSTRGDAKGLLTVSATTLTFYESVGTLGTIEERDDERIRARFAFTGEGMTWNRDVALEATDGGDKLVRREFGEDAAPGPFEYTRCS